MISNDAVFRYITFAGVSGRGLPTIIGHMAAYFEA